MKMGLKEMLRANVERRKEMKRHREVESEEGNYGSTGERDRRQRDLKDVNEPTGNACQTQKKEEWE